MKNGLFCCDFEAVPAPSLIINTHGRHREASSFQHSSIAANQENSDIPNKANLASFLIPVKKTENSCCCSSACGVLYHRVSLAAPHCGCVESFLYFKEWTAPAKMISLMSSNSTEGKLSAYRCSRKNTPQAMNTRLEKVHHRHREMSWSPVFSPPMVWLAVHPAFPEFVLFLSL